jgi:hypothetical protein
LFADTGNHVVRYYSFVTGRVSNLAGTLSTSGFSGDTQDATLALLDSPYGVYMDSTANVFIADTGNLRVRRISKSDNTIQTVAGNRQCCLNTDGSPATLSYISGIYAISGDSNGFIYIADYSSAKIRVLVPSINSTYTIRTLVGNGGTTPINALQIATTSSISRPQGICLDTVGSIYIAEPDANWIRKAFYIDSPTGQPSKQPTSQPSAQPLILPTAQPTLQPTRQPTSQPSAQPLSTPSSQPTGLPSRQPSCKPSGQPSSQPYSTPSGQPSCKPSSQPSCQPSAQPLVLPTAQPTLQPTRQPTSQPSAQPFSAPSSQPTGRPSRQPSCKPSGQPSSQPYSTPSGRPSCKPSSQPSCQPSAQPLVLPTAQPTLQPTRQPTSQPSAQPFSAPSSQPTGRPSRQPSCKPSGQPSSQPYSTPSGQPSCKPSSQPSCQPSRQPSGQPSAQPSRQPSGFPTDQPTKRPVSFPTTQPSAQPSDYPSSFPSCSPSVQPSNIPTTKPSARPSTQPLSSPTGAPSCVPSASPSSSPSALPSAFPSIFPSSQPSCAPSVVPSSTPSSLPSVEPSSTPTGAPSSSPSGFPTDVPSNVPTGRPTNFPSSSPASLPSATPSDFPSTVPTVIPSSFPSNAPSVSPTSSPTNIPSTAPTEQPNGFPTCIPSSAPSSSPSVQPTGIPSRCPRSVPTSRPSSKPSAEPSTVPSTAPTVFPSFSPTELPTSVPSENPAVFPTMQPSGSPSSCPTSQPSDIPVSSPTKVPVADPSASPSSKPSLQPTSSPSHIYPIIISNVLTVSRTSVEVDLVLSKSGVIYSLLYPVNSSNVVPKPSFSDFMKHEKYSASNGLNKVILVYENLIPAHEYALFFMTQHFSNNIGIMPESEIAKTKTIFSTSCCREINMIIVPSVLVAHQNYENFINIMISSLPLHSLTISLQLFDRSTNQSLVSALSSASVSFDSLSSGLTKTLELTALPEGSYSIVGTVSGQETSKYTLFFQQTGSSMITQNRTSFAMKPADTFLPAPLLSSIVYSGDGSFVNVLFDSSTNFGGYQLLTSFPCNNLLDFKCSFISKCQWSDARSLNAFVKTSDECAKPGDIVKLTQDARIKAACVVTTINVCSNYAHWPAMNTSALSSGMKIANALNPILPTIIVSMPSKVSWNCSSLIVDLTGSYGNGGRSWRNMSIIASSDTGVDLSRLQDFLNHKYQMNPPSAIPPSYFPLPGVQYFFQVRMCNFLGACSTSTKSVLVVSEAIPVVKILSSTSSPVRTTRSQALSLLSYASISSSCLGSVSSVDKGSMQYNWTTYLVNGDLRQPQSSVVSTSKDLSRFLLSAYSLESNKVYEMTLLVSSPSGYFQAAAASIQVVVNQGSLVTKVKGGINERNIRVNEILSFDASNSFDEDKGETVRGSEAGLLFEWSCMTLEPVINRTSCVAVFEKPVGLNSAVVTATSLSNADNSKVQWTLKMSDSSRSRSTSTSITVAILPLLSPTISLQSNALLGESGGIMNAGQSLQITGSINIPAGVKSNATWSSPDSSVFPLSALSLTPLLQQFPTSFSSSQSFTMYLVLPANSLAVGTSYTFGLRCQLSYPGKSALSTITINVNSPPTPGSFSIQPMSGREIIDSFTFLCNQWIDANLPLSYQFSYVSLSGMKIVIRSSSIISYASSILPGGSKTNNGSLTAVADIYDSLSANTTSSRVIRVLPASFSSSNGGNVSTSLAATFIASSLSSTSRSSASVDDLMKGTAIASYLLNSANCSLSPNCTALNRFPCYSTSHTCGPCLSSSMIGQKGDSNDKCFGSIPAVSSILKTCVRSCSGHGHCNYTSLMTGNTLSACYEGDFTCVASCDCQIGYRMSKNCEMKDEEVQAKRKLRDQVIDGIVTVVDHQDANEQSISSWISSISEASQVSNELSAKSISSILEIANYAISTVQSNGFSSSNSLSNLLDGLNAISKGMIALTQARNNSRSSSRFSRRLEEVDGSGGVAMLETLQNYSFLLASSMLPGQMPVTASEETFKLHIELLDATGKDTETHRRLSSSTSTTCNSKRTVKIPSTSDQQQSITFPFCGNTSTISPLMLSLVSLSSSLYQNSELTSDSASLFLSSLPCQDPDNCRAEITLEADNSAMMVIA